MFIWNWLWCCALIHLDFIEWISQSLLGNILLLRGKFGLKADERKVSEVRLVTLLAESLMAANNNVMYSCFSFTKKKHSCSQRIIGFGSICRRKLQGLLIINYSTYLMRLLYFLVLQPALMWTLSSRGMFLVSSCISLLYIIYWVDNIKLYELLQNWWIWVHEGACNIWYAGHSTLSRLACRSSGMFF